MKTDVMGIRKLTIVMVWMAIVSMNAQNVREVTRLNEGWRFALGNASDPVKDFGCGTEYFNYLTKANSIHNEAPHSPKFSDAGGQGAGVPPDGVPPRP